MPSFLVLCRRVEVKIEVNGKIEVRLVLLIYGYSLTMSCSDFAKRRIIFVMVVG